MSSETGPIPDPQARPWWLLVALFAGGLVCGVLAVALLGLGTPDFQAYRDPGRAGEVPAAPGTPEPLTGSAEVNAACLRVINEAQDVQSIIGNLEQVSSDGDLQLIDDLVRQLQPIERRLAVDLADCRITAATGPSASSTTTPGPTPSSTSTPAGTAAATPS